MTNGRKLKTEEGARGSLFNAEAAETAEIFFTTGLPRLTCFFSPRKHKGTKIFFTTDFTDFFVSHRGHREHRELLFLTLYLFGYAYSAKGILDTRTCVTLSLCPQRLYAFLVKPNK